MASIINAARTHFASPSADALYGPNGDNSQQIGAGFLSNMMGASWWSILLSVFLCAVAYDQSE